MLYITYMWNFKNNINECIYKIETDSQTQETNLWLPRGRGNGKGQIGGMEVANTNYYTLKS